MKLLDYIHGNRRGIDAHRLEKKALSDPFLSEALEGFDSVEGDHSRAIERLYRRVGRRSVSGNRKRIIWAVAGTAAVLLLFLTLGREFRAKETPEQVVPYWAEMTESTPEAAAGISADSTKSLESIHFEPPKNEIAQASQQQVVTVEKKVVDSNHLARALASTRHENLSLEEIEEKDTVPTNSSTTPEEIAVVGQAETRSRAATESTSYITPPKQDIVKDTMDFQTYVKGNLRPIQYAENDDVSGKVVLEFRVNRQGRPVRIRVVESLSPEADKEAKRLLKNGPAWKLSEEKEKVVIEF